MGRTRAKRLVLLAIIAASALALAWWAAIGDLIDVPFVDLLQVYAVDIYEGDSPLSLADRAPGPTLTRSDLGGADVIGVADPWLLVDDEEWFLFVEIIRERPGAPTGKHGVIGLATSRNEGESWNYQGVVLEEEWHLSYPMVVEEDKTFYMVPESLQSGQVALYRADDYPQGWRQDSILLTGGFADPTVFAWEGRWWLFATESKELDDDTLRLFFSDDLSGPYQEHPASPVVTGDISKARSAGQVVNGPDGLTRFAMDNRGGYGRAVRAFEITTLTTSEYAEKEVIMSSPIAGSGEGWNASGMHHVVPIQIGEGHWVSAVDGYYEERLFTLRP